MNSPVSGYTCRKACIDDLPALIAIYNQSIRSGTVTADTQPVTLTERLAWFRQHNDATRPLFVFEKQQQAVAWLSLQDFYGRKAYGITKEISIYIDQRYRHAGLGTHILAFALTYAAQVGIENLLAFIFEENEASCHLFAGKGFQVWGKLPAVATIHKAYRTLIIMGLRLK